jgi:cob(I)alamin adenosyltransferase
VELILTGRQADSKLIKSADLVTEMLKIKHPYDAGVRAREGIEY